MRAQRVRALLMGGQACVFYGAAEFSRDTDFAIPGKEAVSRISRWAQEKYKISVSGLLIAHHMIAAELPQELQAVLTAIEECEAFPERKFDARKSK